jgi:iron-sulfur cluster assembly accessory protein
MAITLTDSAAAKVKTLLADQPPSAALGLRVRVVGGGCSGLSYDLSLESEARPDDKVFESHGVKIYLDPKSALFVSGTEIDFQKTLMGEGFAFRNPNAKGTCGCGTSFTA